MSTMALQPLYLPGNGVACPVSSCLTHGTPVSLVDSDNRRLSALTLGYDISRCEGVLPSPRRVSALHSLHGRGLLPHAPPCRGAPVLPGCRVLECSPRRGCGRANIFVDENALFWREMKQNFRKFAKRLKNFQLKFCNFLGW